MKTEQEHFNRLRKKVKGFADLEKGWDTYDADPPSSDAIQNELNFLDILEGCDVYLDSADATSMDSILIHCWKPHVDFEWDFFSDGEVGLLKTDEYGPAVYLVSSDPDEIKKYLN